MAWRSKGAKMEDNVKMAMEAAISFMWETWRVTLFQIGVAMLGIIGMILYKKFIRRG